MPSTAHAARTPRTALLAVLTLLLSSLLVLAGTAPAQAAVTVFPVPTSNAGLGRITTAPDGSMWFTETEVGKVGRITTSGQIQEFVLPPTTTGDVDGSVKGIDVGADGVAWVTYDYGRKIVSMNPATGATTSYGLGSYPYGGAVRVAADGRVFVTLNYDYSSVATLPAGATQFVESGNAPECADVLGEALDGTMWCKNGNSSAQDSITHLNGDASSGTTYPLPSDATYPQGLAGGPVGSIWFTRSSSGTWVTSPDDGSIGYLDQASGATKIWQTGSRSAPQDIVLGPDGQMWFTNRGAAPGIGHISSTGVGVISAVGNYKPTSLTFGPDGAVWFTDTEANAVVRVTTDELQTTNVDLGDGVTMIAPGTGGGGGGGGTTTALVGTLPKVKGVTPVTRGRMKVRVACPKSAGARCAGRLRVELAQGGKALAKSKKYSVKPGKKSSVTVKLTRKGLGKLRRGKVVKVRLELTSRDSSKVLAKRTIKVRRR